VTPSSFEEFPCDVAGSRRREEGDVVGDFVGFRRGERDAFVDRAR
jgi:hypothetical protein